MSQPLYQIPGARAADEPAAAATPAAGAADGDAGAGTGAAAPAARTVGEVLAQSHVEAVFATRDELLLNASKSVVKQWTKKLQWTCKPVFSPEQLNKALSSLASA